MSLRITTIDIKNFRSIRNLSLSPGKLGILVGKNDSGKSNLLRALNLFFNGRTMPGDDLDFNTDHNVFNQPNRRAKEISIKLKIALPESYRDTNGDFVEWERRWRAEGLKHDKYSGRRRFDGPRGGTRFKEVNIPNQSNVHGLLRNINYVYVPAIKDPEYFLELRASIYNIIAAVADKEFRNSSQDFEQSISNQLQDLTTEITTSLGFRSRLALPKDLSHIFESLDFLSEDQNISLASRGDGIKARHIPLILKFMANKKRQLNVQGSAPHMFIWGYEEPENNLELSSCVELASQFRNFVDNGISQIFLTTHSPVFDNRYHKDDDNKIQTTCHHIFQERDKEGTKTTTELSDLDHRMGTIALFSPMVTELEDRVRRQEKARLEVERLAEAKHSKLFVEGPSDQLIIEKALKVFAPNRMGEIDVVTQNSGGINYVIDMLQSWRSRAKHYPELPKAAGLLDFDPEAKSACTKWNQVNGNVKSAKCFTLGKTFTPPHIIPIFQAGFRVPMVLECIYDRQTWEWAEKKGHLRARDLTKVIPPDLLRDIIDGKIKRDDILNDTWAIFVKSEFKQEGKLPMAHHFYKMKSDDFRARLPFLETLVNEIILYLFPDSDQLSQSDVQDMTANADNVRLYDPNSPN